MKRITDKMNELIQALSEIKEGDFQGEDENLKLKELKKMGCFQKTVQKMQVITEERDKLEKALKLTQEKLIEFQRSNSEHSG